MINGILSPDGGPVYTESNFHHYFPEPYNTITSFLFTLLSLFWFLKLRKEYKIHVFLTISCCILFIGSVGGTLYHGLRRYPIFLVMDYLPIMILCFLAAFYFLFRAIQNPGIAIFLMIGYFLAILGIHYLLGFLPRSYQISINYALMAAMVVVCTFVFLKTIQFQKIVWIYRALFFFLLALGFRIADSWHWIPMGTHFLWHIFGMLSTASMFNFIYETDKIQIRDSNSIPN
jgi:hemolysin III